MKSKYKIYMALLEDKFQTQLCEDGIKPNTNPLADITTIDYSQIVFCPFCLYRDSLRHFLVNKRLGNCPECENNMLIKTLLRMLKWTPKDYAKFVYEYPFALFWSKCSSKFEIWKKRLYVLNMNFEFWETYKYLKSQIESEEEYH